MCLARDSKTTTRPFSEIDGVSLKPMPDRPPTATDTSRVALAAAADADGVGVATPRPVKARATAPDATRMQAPLEVMRPGPYILDHPFSASRTETVVYSDAPSGHQVRSIQPSNRNDPGPARA